LRDYDKEPIIIKNNLSPIMHRAHYLVFYYVLIIYFVFLSGLVDWSVEGKTWTQIFIEEANKSFRFTGIFFFGLVGTVDLAVRIIILVRKPRKIYFKNDIITADKCANELLEIKLSELSEIKQSPYAIFGTGNANTIGKYILVIPLVLLFAIPLITLTILMQIILFFLKTVFRKNIRLTFYPYIILFCENTNKLINISLIDKDVYQDVRQYFIDRARFDIDKADINLNFTNFPELED